MAKNSNLHSKSRKSIVPPLEKSSLRNSFIYSLIFITFLVHQSSCDTIVINHEKIDTENLNQNSRTNDGHAQKRQDLSSLMVNGPDAADILQAAFAQAGVDLGGNIEQVSSASDFLSAIKRPSITERLRSIKLPSLPASITSAFNRRKVATGNAMASMLVPVLSPPPGGSMGQVFHRHLIPQSKPIKFFGGHRFKNPFKKDHHQPQQPIMMSASGSIPSFVLHPNNFHNPINDQYVMDNGQGQRIILPPPILSFNPSTVSTSSSLPASSGFLINNYPTSSGASFGAPSGSSSAESQGQGQVNEGELTNYKLTSGHSSGQPSSMTIDHNSNNNGVNRPSNFISLTNNGNNAPSFTSSSFSPVSSSASSSPVSSLPGSSSASSLPGSSSSSSMNGMNPKTSSYMVNLNYGSDNWTPTSALSVNGFKPIVESNSNSYNSNSNSYNNGNSNSYNSNNHNYNNQQITPTSPPSSSLNNYSSLINTETKRASHSLYETFAKLSTGSDSSSFAPSLMTGQSSSSPSSPSNFPASSSSGSNSPAPTYTPAPTYVPQPAYAHSPAALSMPAPFSRTYDPWKFNDSVPEESSNDILKYSLPNSAKVSSSSPLLHSDESTESILSGLHKLFPINPSAILEQINKNEHLIKSKSSVDCVNKHLGWCDFTDNYPT